MQHLETIPVKFLRREDGLPSGQIQGLAQDLDGRLWLATPSGLACYDGSRTKTYSRSDGLLSHGLRAVDIMSDGRVWVGSDAGFDVMKNGRIISSEYAVEDWAYGLVDCIHCTDSNVWLGTSAGLVHRDDHRFALADHEKLRAGLVNAVGSAPDGTVWASAAGHGLVVNADGWREPENPDWRAVGDINCIARGPGNHMLLGGQSGFAEVSRSGIVVACPNDADSNLPVSAMHFARQELWVAAGNLVRVYRRVASGWHVDRVALKGHFVNAITADNYGNIWIATESHGLAKLSVLTQAIKRIPVQDAQAVFSIRAGRNDREIIVGGDRASWTVNTARTSRPTTIPALQNKQVWDVLPEADGSLYAATANGLFYLHGNNAWEHVGSDDPVLSLPNRCLTRHRAQLFAGSIGGCVIVNPDRTVDAVNTKHDEPIGYVYTLTSDNNGRLWAGTLGNGLWFLDKDRFERFEHPDLSVSGNTYAIDVARDKRIVFVQDDRIFVISADGELRHVATSSDPIAGWTVRWGNDGSIWTGSATGLTQYNSEDGRLLRQVIALVGLSNWEFTTSRSLYIDDDGAFYCGVNSGLVYVNRGYIEDISAPPVVRLSAVRWTQAKPVRDGDVLVVPFGRWNVTIEVFASWFLDEEDLQFRFRLSGFDDDWRPLTSQAMIKFNSLPPGDYKLEAQAYNRMVGFGPGNTLMQIRVTKPLWANRLLMAPFAGLRAMQRLSNAVTRNRFLNEKNVELERIVRERTADLEQTRQRLEALNRELATDSLTDALTGIGNRRFFDEQLAQAITNAARTGVPLSLILIDVDHFKAYNDLYGHAKGDDCLSFVARKLVSTLYRPTDLLARYGGEEFAIILPDVTVGGAMSLAERLGQGIENLNLTHAGVPETGHVTVSVGVSTFRFQGNLEHCGDAATRLIESADAALYEAKEYGRNQCVFREMPPLQPASFDANLPDNPAQLTPEPV